MNYTTLQVCELVHHLRLLIETEHTHVPFRLLIETESTYAPWDARLHACEMLFGHQAPHRLLHLSINYFRSSLISQETPINTLLETWFAKIEEANPANLKDWDAIRVQDGELVVRAWSFMLKNLSMAVFNIRRPFRFNQWLADAYANFISGYVSYYFYKNHPDVWSLHKMALGLETDDEGHYIVPSDVDANALWASAAYYKSPEAVGIAQAEWLKVVEFFKMNFCQFSD